MVFLLILFILALIALAALAYWFLIDVTEGVYLGRRMVVWLYDITAHKYDGIKEFDDSAERFFVTRPLLHTLAHPAPLILDVATGTGRVPWYLLEEPTFHGQVIGLDASEKMMALAVEKLRPYHARVAFVQGLADLLPFPANSFQAVTCLEALEFFPNDTAALQAMIHVLAPGGTLLVTRRRGWEAKTFIRHNRSPEAFAAHLQTLGVVDVRRQLWQEEYDLIFAFKPG